MHRRRAGKAEHVGKRRLAGARGERQPEEGDARRLDADVAVGEIDPVDEHEADDLAERQRDDGEIVAAQAQHRKAEQHPPESGEDAGDGQADPERPRPERRQRGRDHVGGDDRIGVGADGVEGDVAEIEQSGEADDDVEAPGEHHVDEDLHAEIVDPLDGAALPGERQRHPREDQQRRRVRRAAATPCDGAKGRAAETAPGAGGADDCRGATAAGRRTRQRRRTRRATGGRRAPVDARGSGRCGRDERKAQAERRPAPKCRRP